MHIAFRSASLLRGHLSVSTTKGSLELKQWEGGDDTNLRPPGACGGKCDEELEKGD